MRVLLHRLQVLLLAGCAACSGADDGPRSVLLVTLDTTRADALSCLGARAGLTPRLDALAAEGVLFTQARTTAPLTLPAHSSMMTGLIPPRHGVRDNGRAPLTQAAATLAEAASAAGIETAAFVGALVLDPAFGLDQGFETYDAPAPKRGKTKLEGEQERPAGEVIDAALSWFARRESDRPFLLWVHLFDAHAPYAAPAAFQRAGRSAYHAEVAYMDAEIGRLLDELQRAGELDNTYVAVVGDHGEALGEHGEETHGVHVYDATIRVPLLLRAPRDARAGTRSDAVVSVVDVAPTLAAALGVDFAAPGPGADEIDGRDLGRAESPPERGAYFESYYGWASFGWSPVAGWADARGKYLHAPSPRFFEPVDDPGEVRDLAPDDPERVRASLHALGQALEGAALPADGGVIDGALQRGLRGLGYLSVGAPVDAWPHPLDLTRGPSPVDREDELRELLDCTYLANAGRCAEARPRLQRLVAANPENWQALEYLGFCLLAEGDAVGALPHLERLSAAERASAGVLVNLATCLRHVGRAAEVLPTVLRALEQDPDHIHALRSAIFLLDQAGRQGDAAPYQRRLKALLEDG